MTYYYVGGNGDSFVDAVIHADADCPDDDTRPIADSTVDSIDANFCPECVDTPDGKDSDPGDGDMQNADAEQLIEQGICPWCDDYEGEYIGNHASSAHPDEWREYKSAKD